MEDHHIAVGIVRDHGALVGGAGAVEYPLGHGGAGVGAGVHAAVGAQILIVLGDGQQRLAVLVTLQRGSGGLGGSGLGGGGLLLRGLDGVAVGIGGGGSAALEVDILVAGHVIGGGILLIALLQLLGGIGQIRLIVLLVVAGDLLHRHHLLKQGGGHALPVHQLQVGL